MIQPTLRRRSRGVPGFSLVEILIVIGIIAVLLAIILPATERARERANEARCASNLREIGQSLVMYANDNHGSLPRTRYVAGAALTAGTGAAGSDPFDPGGPQPNDTAAPLFLLMRTQRITSAIFICPYNDEVVYVADKANPSTHANWTDYRKNLGYSFVDVYPDPSNVTARYGVLTRLGAEFAIAADLNSGNGAATNSRNHEGRGQNVLFADGHVRWANNATCGIRDDDIYVNRNNQTNASPLDDDDSILLPTAN